MRLDFIVAAPFFMRFRLSWIRGRCSLISLILSATVVATAGAAAAVEGSYVPLIRVVSVQVDPEIERMMEEARRRQLEMAKMAGQGQDQGGPAGELEIGPDIPPSVVLGSLIPDGLLLRSDGRFSLSRFRISDLPKTDSEGRAVNYSMPRMERVHVRLEGAQGVLSDHYYTGVEDSQYGGWNMSLSMGAPKAVNPNFIRHNAILSPGEYALSFFIDDFLIGKFPFSVIARKVEGEDVYQLEGFWNDLIAVTALTSPSYLHTAQGYEDAGRVTTVFYSLNRAGGKVEHTTNPVFLKVYKDGEPYAVGDGKAHTVAGTKEWFSTTLQWLLIGEKYLDVNRIKDSSSPTWGMDAPRAVLESYMEFVSKEVGEERVEKTIISPSEFADGAYRLELIDLKSGAVKIYSFTRRGGEFVAPKGGAAFPSAESAFLNAGENVLWLNPIN